jgi:hypothetical protein
MLNISVSAPFVWRCLNVTRTLPDLEELPTRSGATGKTEGPVLCRFLGRGRGGVNYARCGRRPRSAKARSRGRWSQVVPRGLWGLRPVAASEAR